jgi:hypothetical protein
MPKILFNAFHVQPQSLIMISTQSNACSAQSGRFWILLISRDAFHVHWISHDTIQLINSVLHAQRVPLLIHPTSLNAFLVRLKGHYLTKISWFASHVLTRLLLIPSTRMHAFHARKTILSSTDQPQNANNAQKAST